MLHATRRRTPPLSAALATAFFASKPQPSPLFSPRLVDAAVSRCPSDALALSFFLWCARRPAYFHPPASFDRILPAATRLASRLRTAPALLRELRAVGCPIRPHTFLLLLRLYWRGGLYPLVLQLFDQMPLWGFHPNVFALNVALDVHLRTGRLDAALRLLRERDKPSPNYLTYAIFVTHLSRAGDWSGVRNCFISMLQQGFLPSAASLASVFVCCSKAGTMSELLQLLSFTLVSGHQLNSAMWTCFIAGICREGRLDEACRMLAKMLDSGSSPTVVTYTPLVKGLFRAGRHNKVHELLGSMASNGCSPDLVFYNVLMDCMMKERRYDYALYIYLNLHRRGIKPDAYTLSTLVQVLQLSHNMVLLPRLILGTGISYDLVACNSMLSALCKSGFPSEAIQFYIDMVDAGFRPDSYSYVRCLDSLCQLGRIDHAKSFYRSIVDPNIYVHASILRGLVRSGKNRMALKIFGDAVRQNYALDAVCYTIVLHGLFQAHLVEEACKLFDKMKLLGMASNTCIYNVMLRGLCRTRDMHAVTQLLGEMECAGVQMDSISFNILVVLLIKLQRISSATTLVREMLNLGMKLSTKTHWLLSQSIGHAFNVEDATVAESDASDSTYIPQIVKKNSVTAETSSSDASAEQLRLRRVLPKDHLVPGDILFLPVNIQESSVAAKTKKFGDRNKIDFLRSIEIYKDKAIIVVNKPPGMPVQVHRLDRDCSGVLVLGRTQFSASILHAIFRDKTADALADDKGTQQVLQRKYVALVIGTPRHPKGLLSAPLAKVVLQDGKSERLTVRAGSNTTSVQDALTEYRVIESCPQGYTWLELFPLTGRKHQLRVHCAEVLGTPIVGDYKYGRQAHQNWMPLPLPQTVDEELLKKRRLPFGLALGGGSIAEEQPQLHLHCKQMILPDISAAVHRLQSADVDFSDLEKLSFVAPLPLHMRLSWEVFKSLVNK